jgi:hypothetical protein
MQADARAQQRVLLRQVERLCKGRHVLRGGRRIVQDGGRVQRVRTRA